MENIESVYYIETNRTFTLLRKYAWIFTLTVAVGGLWFPKLGLFVLPVIAGLFFSFQIGRKLFNVINIYGQYSAFKL